LADEARKKQFILLKIKADKEQFEVVKELVFALEKRIINLEKK